jgi:hypothetical protein
MTIFNTTLIISSVQFLILVSDTINGGLTAVNSSYGLSYGDVEGGNIEEKLLVIQAIQNNSLFGKFKKTNYILNDDCIISLYDKNNMTNEITTLYTSSMGFYGSSVQCQFAKAIFTTIRQKKLISKFKKINKKLNDVKRKVDYMANNRDWW